MPKKTEYGFTLIELLVVISVIAILSVIGMAIYGSVQGNARDAKRRSDVEAISSVLEAHYNDITYPCNAAPSTPYCTTLAITDGTFFASNAYPVNPGPGGADYQLTIPAERTSYTICARLENGNGNSSDYGDGTNFATPPPATYYCKKNQL